MLRSCAGILLSRVTGLLRDIFNARYWGATDIAQAAYTTAFSIPNSLRALFGEGAFSGAFVPLISRELSAQRAQEAWKLANRAISLQCVFLLAITGLGSIASLLMYHFGVLCCDNELNATIFLILPLLLPFAILICAAAAFNGVLNSLKSFFIPTTIQLVFNLTQVATIIYLSCFWANTELTALIIFCLSTSFSGLLEILLLLFACRRKGYCFHFDLHWRDDQNLKTFVRNIIPGLAGSGVNQINSLVDKWLATLLGAGAIGALNYSQRLVYLPVGLFGVAMSMVCLPALSRATAKQDTQGIADSLNYAFRTVLFMALPCVAFLAPCGRDVLSLLFQRGAFQHAAVNASAYALAFYIIGVPAFCCAKIAVTPFHARLDTRTPMKIGIFCMFLNLVLNLALMRPLQQGGFALATSISSWTNLALLMYFNQRYIPSWSPKPILTAAVTLGGAATVAGFFAHKTLVFCHNLFTASTFWTNLLAMSIALALCGCVYLALCMLFRRPEPRELLSHRKRKV